MNWWRAHHGISNDAKLAAVARHAQVPPGMALSVWIVILDHASQNERRGNIGSLDYEEIAALLGFEEGDVSGIMQEIRRKGMILPGGMIANWAKRQPERERDIPDHSTDRVRAFRDRHKNETHGNALKHIPDPETTGNVIEEIRVEEKRSVCGSESGSVFKNGGDKEKPSTAEQLSESEIRAYLEPFPRIANPDEGIRAVMSVIDRRCLAAAVACRDRYLASGEVARGAIQEAATWIFTQAKTGWAGKWPARATPPRKESRTAQLERILKEEA